MIKFCLFIFIWCCNAFDFLATTYGLYHHLVEEQNPIALHLWEIHPILFITIKLFFSIIILYFPFFTSKEIWKKRIWTIVLIGLTSIFVIISIMHIIWLSIYISIVFF